LQESHFLIKRSAVICRISGSHVLANVIHETGGTMLPIVENLSYSLTASRNVGGMVSSGAAISSSEPVAIDPRVNQISQRQFFKNWQCWQ